MSRPKTAAPTAGFTLTEIIIGIAIAAMLAAVLMASFLTQYREMERQRAATEMRSNVLLASNRIARDVRQAGYGLLRDHTNVTPWVTWVTNMDDVVEIQQGAGTDPDRLRILSVAERPASRVAVAVNTGDMTLDVAAGTGASFDATRRKLLYVGRRELVRIESVAVDTLTVTAHPTLTGRGFQYPHPAGTPIELLHVVEYRCENVTTSFPFRPYLARDTLDGVSTNIFQQLLVMGISDFQASITNERIRYTVTGQSQNPERDYVDPLYGDAFRRMQGTAETDIRNVSN